MLYVSIPREQCYLHLTILYDLCSCVPGTVVAPRTWMIVTQRDDYTKYRMSYRLHILPIYTQ
jgi:hypothetical protein